MNNNILILGGDTRQLYAAQYLVRKGNKVRIYACEHGKIPSEIQQAQSLDEAFESDIVILPLPVSKNGRLLNTPLSSQEISLRDVTEGITDRHTVFFGMGAKALSKQLEAKAGLAIDYYENESLIYKNALLTAEGLISIVLERTSVTASGMRIAVLGYGRIAGFTADKLKLLGANVTVFARSSLQRTMAQTRNIRAISLDEIKEHIDNYDCIINTIPSPVLFENEITLSHKECIFIEAASFPYGIDAEACAKNERTLVKAFSLPGKIAPKSAGYIIGETIENMLKENGI